MNRRIGIISTRCKNEKNTDRKEKTWERMKGRNYKLKLKKKRKTKWKAEGRKWKKGYNKTQAGKNRGKSRREDEREINTL